MLQDVSYRLSRIYFPNMDGRTDGEHIRLDGGSLMTLAEKKHLIKDQLKYLQKDSYQQFDLLPGHLPNYADSRQYSSGGENYNLMDIKHRIDSSTFYGIYKINPISAPRILINIRDDSHRTLACSVEPRSILNSKDEFKQLLLLIEHIYCLYLQNDSIHCSEILNQSRISINLELQLLLGFDIHFNNSILPLKIMCIRKGFFIIYKLFDILNPLNQKYIFSLFIENISGYLFIYGQLDPNQNMFLHFTHILPQFDYDKLCEYAVILVQFLDSSIEIDSHLYLNIPIALLKTIHNVMECYSKSDLTQRQVNFWNDISLDKALNKYCDIK